MGANPSKIELPKVGAGVASLAKPAHDPMKSTERENLGAWHRHGIDVSDVYEVIDIITQGHMGEVTKVRRKREERGVHNSATRARRSVSEPDLISSVGGRRMSTSPFNGIKKRSGTCSETKDNNSIRRPKSPFSSYRLGRKKAQKQFTHSSSECSSSQDSLHPCEPPDSPKKQETNKERPPSPRSILKQASWGRRDICDTSNMLDASLFAPDLGGTKTGAEVKHTRSISEVPTNAPPPPPPPRSEDKTQELSEDSDSDEDFDDDSFAQVWRERLEGAKKQRERVLRAKGSSSETQESLNPHGLNSSEHSRFESLHSSLRRSVRFERLYACKTVLVSRVKRGHMEQLLNEIKILRTLDHPYILQLFEVYQTKRKIWLITELCTGGDLTTRKLNEPEATAVIEQILRALSYMHSRGICHRNIKLEHILYEDSSKDATIRLIDFGLSSRYDRAEKSRRAVRTAYTLSPEIAGESGQYTEKTDIWSAGIIAWILLAGDAPFIRHEDDLKDKEKLDRLIRADYQFGITWKGRGISSHAKKFVHNCLQRYPWDRWTAKEALQYVESTWIPALEMEDVEDEGRALKRTISFKRRSGTENAEMADVINVEDINRFCKYGMLKKTILMTMAQTMDREDVERLREIFLAADTDDVGTIGLLELKQAFCQINQDMDEKTVESFFQGIDQDHSGEIHWAEFIAALSESYGLITMDRLAEAFDRIDSDGKGYISREDLKMILGKDYDDKLVDTMIKEADYKENGQIDYEELMQLMFEDPVAGAKTVGDLNESLRSAGMGDIAEPTSEEGLVFW